MKISKLSMFAWALFALVLTTTTVFSQGRGNGNRNVQSKNGTCLEQISGLSENQKSEIGKLNATHQQEIATLRNNRRSITDLEKKTEIRTEMLEKVESHRNAVKNLLTENQKKQYELLQSRGNNCQNAGKKHGKSNRGKGKNGNKGACRNNTTNS